MLKLRDVLLASTALQCSLSGSTFAAGQLPAVSAPNTTVGAMACSANGGEVSALMSFAEPLGHDYGAQADGLLSVSGDGHVTGQATGQLFWRDPEKAMVGLYGAYLGSTRSGVPSGFRLGPEGEVYLDRITLTGVVGWDFGMQTLFAHSRASLYVDDNTKLYAGYDYDGRSIGNIGVEHSFNANFSGFIEGQIGDNGYRAILGGAKFHFGGQDTSPEIASTHGRPMPVPAERTLYERDHRDVVPLWMQPCAQDVAQAGSTPPPTSTVIGTTSAPTTTFTPTTTAAPTSTPTPTTTGGS
jgi:hypothetical protein